jgi:hypothetical protein
LGERLFKPGQSINYRRSNRLFQRCDMRKSIFILALTATVPFVAWMGMKPAKAEILYPYCTTETRWDGPHCDFRSFEQCVAAVAGQNTTCVPNKWYWAAQTSMKRRTG